MQDMHNHGIGEDANSLKREYRKYLRDCGIPSRFLKDDTTLREYGQTGEFFAELIPNTQKRNDYFKNKSALNLYGDWAEEIMYGIVRGLLLFQKEGQIIAPADLMEMDRAAINNLMELQVIGMPYFYIGDYENCPLPNEKLYVVESFVRSFLKRAGKILILHSTHPINEMKWYGESTRRDLEKYGRDVQVDTRN